MKKQQVFYIHGAGAFSDYKNFLKYLEKIEIRDLPWAEESPQRWSKTFREDLGENFEVFTPQMPNKQNAKYQEWKIWFERHFEYLKDDIIIVGWSCGGYFFSKYLLENQFPFKIKTLILMAAPYENVTDDPDGEDGGDFTFNTSRTSELEAKAEKIIIMHSKDDFVVPYEHALKYKAALPEAELMTFEDKNHFLVEELPELLAKIREVSENN